MDTAISKILARTDANNLPAIPKVLLDLIETIQSPSFNFDELAKIISQDASLSAKVLSAANSPFYRQWGEIQDLNRVLVVLGLKTLKTIAMTSVVQQFFNQAPAAMQNFLEVIWFRSLTCAHIARRLATLTGYQSPDQAYLTGLLHRLGQLALLQCLPKEYAALLKEHSEDLPADLEQESIGVTHSEMGAYLVEQWQIHSFMADAVLYQSKPVRVIFDCPPLVKIINLAAQLSRSDAKNDPAIFEHAFNLFGLNQNMVEELLAETSKQVEKTAGSLSIAIPNSKATSTELRSKLEDRKSIQKQLSGHAHDIAFMGAISQSNELPEKMARVLALIQRNLSIVFGFREVAIFLLNDDTNTLEGHHFGDPTAEKLWSSVSILLEKNHSLLANALLLNRVLSSFSTSLPDPEPVVDRQVCRLLEAEGILAIPLIIEEQKLGVIAVSLNTADVKKTKTKLGLILLFAQEASKAILGYRNANHRIQESTAAIHTGFQLQASKVIHEVSNPLSIINNYLYLLSKKLGEQSPEEITFIQEEINRVGDLILRLSDTPDNITTDSEFIDINEVINDLLALFESGLFSTQKIKTHLNLDKNIPLIESSKPKLKQLLTNLIKNAAEAMLKGGTISITTRDNVTIGKKAYIEIQVADNGPGLPKEILNNLFSPVISTKDAKHAGLGLTITKNLVDELSGTIHCLSNATKGTWFQICLPRKTQKN